MHGRVMLVFPAGVSRRWARKSAGCEPRLVPRLRQRLCSPHLILGASVSSSHRGISPHRTILFPTGKSSLTPLSPPLLSCPYLPPVPPVQEPSWRCPRRAGFAWWRTSLRPSGTGSVSAEPPLHSTDGVTVHISYTVRIAYLVHIAYTVHIASLYTVLVHHSNLLLDQESSASHSTAGVLHHCQVVPFCLCCLPPARHLTGPCPSPYPCFFSPVTA